MKQGKAGAIGVKLSVQGARNKRRSKPRFLRGAKSLGPKSGNRGNRGSF